MDVLQVLKAEFKERISDMENPMADSTWIARFDFHLALESEFLLPEIQAVSGPNGSVCHRLERELLTFSDLLKNLRVSSVETEQLKLRLVALFQDHVEFVEEKIFPLMRQKISTSDREALVSVVHDFKTEFHSNRAKMA